MNSLHASQHQDGSASLIEATSIDTRIDRAGAERAIRALLRSLGQDVCAERYRRVPAEMVAGFEKLLSAPLPDVEIHRNQSGSDELTIQTVRYLWLCPHLSGGEGIAQIGYLPATLRIGGDELEEIMVSLARQPRLPAELAAIMGRLGLQLAAPDGMRGTARRSKRLSVRVWGRSSSRP